MSKITVKQYAKKRGVSCVAVTRAMNKGRNLINILYYSKIGRDWLLEESDEARKINIKKGLVIQK